MSLKLQKVSDQVVRYSLKVESGEKVLITSDVVALPLIKYLIQDIQKVGGSANVRLVNSEVDSFVLKYGSDDTIQLLSEQKKFDVDHYDCFIFIHYGENDYESNIVPHEKKKKLSLATTKSDFIRVNKRKWVILNYPSKTDAYKAGMASSTYFDYCLDVMNFNYAEMDEMLKPLKELMEKTDRVRIVAPDTDLTFSIKNMPIIPCSGEANIPDGEIYTAPVKDSVNGTITFNTPSPYMGYVFHHVSLTFEDGKIVACKADDQQEMLENIFDTDEGSRYVGEFSLGIHPMILHPVGDILFDEKIIGSIHFTPGSAYQDAYNGNDSAIHWDLVLIQRSDYGGGELYFDDVLIRKDGLFVLPELKHLNYDLK